MKTQYDLPSSALNSRLQKMLQYRAKTCLHFFEPVQEESPNDGFKSFDYSSGKSSPENDKSTFDICEKSYSNDTSASLLSSSDQHCHFSEYVAKKQANGISTSELIMQVFDNDDIEGIIPPRFLVNKPDAIIDNIRKEVHSSSSESSSKQSSFDGEVSYDVHLVRQLKRRLRVSTAAVTRTPYHLHRRNSFCIDVNVSSRLVSASKLAALNEDSFTSTEYDGQPKDNQRKRKVGIVRSRGSVLQWLASRSLSSDSYNSSRCSVQEEVFESGSEVSDVESSEASDAESYHSCPDET